MRLGLVVESDPDGRCSLPLGEVAVLVAGETFVIGRMPDANLVISADHMNRRNCGIAAGVGAFVLTDVGVVCGLFDAEARAALLDQQLRVPTSLTGFC